MRFGTRLHATAQALALLSAVAAAQPRPGGAAPPVGVTAPGAGGVEIAAGSMVVAIFPTIGGQVSIPASQQVRLEVGTHVLSWMLKDDGPGLVTHVQVRIPFRHGPPGSRRSLLVGASAFTIHQHVYSIDRWKYKSAVRPHAGVSWQWQKSRNVDVRIDLQGLFIGQSTPFVVPFATFSMVWHRDRRWS
jgi:hypothetical protein